MSDAERGEPSEPIWVCDFEAKDANCRYCKHGRKHALTDMGCALGGHCTNMDKSVLCTKEGKIAQ